MIHTLLYTHDFETEANAVFDVTDGTAKICRGVKPYSKRFYANRYLTDIMTGIVRLRPEPDEIIEADPGESHEAFIERVTEGLEHVGFRREIKPDNEKDALAHPAVFHLSKNIFPPSYIWYKTAAQAKKDADGFDTIFLGSVDVYDPEEIERIEAEIASYPV